MVAFFFALYAVVVIPLEHDKKPSPAGVNKKNAFLGRQLHHLKGTRLVANT